MFPNILERGAQDRNLGWMIDSVIKFFNPKSTAKSKAKAEKNWKQLLRIYFDELTEEPKTPRKWSAAQRARYKARKAQKGKSTPSVSPRKKGRKKSPRKKGRKKKPQDEFAKPPPRRRSLRAGVA